MTTQTQIRWNASKADENLIGLIVDRAMASGYPVPDGRQGLEMDLIATHLNCMRLKLRELLTADDFNFAHDIAGIQRHIDRETAQFRNCFVPRFAKK